MRRYLETIGMACAMTFCASCGDSHAPRQSGYSEYEKPDTTTSVQTMKDYHYAAEVEAGGVRYTYDIVRHANDTLPLVAGDDNEQYTDNYIRLRVNREGSPVFDRTFTKQSFRDHLEKDFMKRSVLEGMAFDRAEGDKLRFAASVSYPGSDVFIPLSITIAPDGSMSISKDEILDTAVEVDTTIAAVRDEA